MPQGQPTLIEAALELHAVDPGLRAHEEVRFVDLHAVQATQVQHDVARLGPHRSADAAPAAGRNDPAPAPEQRSDLLEAGRTNRLHLGQGLSGACPHEPQGPEVAHRSRRASRRLVSSTSRAVCALSEVASGYWSSSRSRATNRSSRRYW